MEVLKRNQTRQPSKFLRVRMIRRLSLYLKETFWRDRNPFDQFLESNLISWLRDNEKKVWKKSGSKKPTLEEAVLIASNFVENQKYEAMKRFRDENRLNDFSSIENLKRFYDLSS
jgi:hypothetical protein